MCSTAVRTNGLGRIDAAEAPNQRAGIPHTVEAAKV
jgi:hypothetical protein